MTVTRRTFLQRAAVGAATTTAAGGLLDAAVAGAARVGSVVPLPSASQFRADVQKMVGFGPRLPGYGAHNAYCDWLEDEFVGAGLELSPADEFVYDRWRLGAYSLDVLDGSSPGPLPVAFPYVRCAGTGPQGITAPLSYATVVGTYGDSYPYVGPAPVLQGGSPGSIFVIELPIPAKNTAAEFLLEAGYSYWPGHSPSDWGTVDLTRPYGMALPVDYSSFVAAGAKAVLIIAENSSYAAIAGSFTPHQAPQSTPLPVCIIDRDTGATLVQQAKAGAHARLTVNAPVQKSTMRTITAVLPGQSDETIICNTHSDGQNAIEENGGVALLGLARHFGSLPLSQRKRTLVFAVWSAHMTDPTFQPELDGWLKTHKGLADRAVGGITIEHLGCRLWIDDPVKGYYDAGLNEPYAIWTTEGQALAHATPLLAKYDLALHALLHGPVEITVGQYLTRFGIPNVSGIAGPVYLVVVSENGEIDKLDFDLASRQVGFYADMVRFFDAADAKALRVGDPFLGNPAVSGEPALHPRPSRPVASGPADRFVVADSKANRLAVRFYGRRQHNRAVLVTVGALDSALSGVTVELRRGNTLYAQSAAFTASGRLASIMLQRRDNKKFTPGTYSLVVRERGKPLGRLSVHITNQR
jgi:hypothetical protein